MGSDRYNLDNVTLVSEPRFRACPPLPSGRVSAQNRMVNFLDKLIPWEKLSEWRANLQASGKRLVVPTGVFDLLYLGHVAYLETARQKGDSLLVGVNCDRAVQELKGPERPVNTESDRASVVAALASVDAVCIFPAQTAAEFLKVARPDVYVK